MAEGDAPHATGSPQGSGRRVSLGVIFLALFLDLVGFGILFPLYPEMMRHYLAHEPGLLGPLLERIEAWFPQASEAQRITLFGGILTGAYAGVQFLTSPFWGRLSDRVGRRPILLLSMTASLVASLLWIFAGSFNLLLLSRLAAACFGGAAVCASAAVADGTDTPQARARGMGFIGMAFGLGFILGPMIGGFAFEILPKLGAADASGFALNPFSSVAIIASVLAAVNLAWAWFSFSETLPPERRGTVTSERSANPLVLLLGTRVQVRLNLAAAAHALFFAGMEGTLSFLAWQRLDYQPRDIAIIFGGMGFIAALVQGGVFRRLAPRTGAAPLGIAGFIFLAIGFAGVALVDHRPSVGMLWLGISLMSVGTGLVFPALSTLISLSADEHNQGRVMGAFRSAGSLGRAVGPLLAAITYFTIAPSAPYWTGAVAMILPLALLLASRQGSSR